jgi:hypothetical protein
MERDLVAEEGVDEGSAASTVESADSAGGNPAQEVARPAGKPAREADPAPPEGEIGADGQGQQLEVGEG